MYGGSELTDFLRCCWLHRAVIAHEEVGGVDWNWVEGITVTVFKALKGVD